MAAAPDVDPVKVRELVKRTGRCMMDCTYALARSNNDINGAILYLREHMPTTKAILR